MASPTLLLSVCRVLSIALLGLLLPWTSQAATRLGLHVTQEELVQWRQRALSGPYKSTGDAQTNSPGDWDRINANAETFRGAPTAGYWGGPTGSGCQSGIKHDPPIESVRLVRDGAFKALIKQDNDLKIKVRDWIMAQQNRGTTNFSNRDRWCIQNTASENTFTTAEWLNAILFTMDYIEILDPAVFTSAQQTTLRNWFIGFADMCNQSMKDNLGTLFVNRLGGDYTTTKDPNYNPNIAYMNSNGTPGPKFSVYGQYWNNRKSGVAHIIATIGVKFNIAAYKTETNRYGKEVVMFAVYPGGFLTDFHRSVQQAISDQGWQYACGLLGGILGLADVMARNGDRTVYDFVTSQGVFGSEGGSKSLLFAMTSMFQYEDGTFNRYGTDTPSEAGQLVWRIDGRYQTPPNEQALNSFYLILGNMYYKSSYITGAYRRQNAGTIAYPTVGDSRNGSLDYQGQAGLYPGVLFMWGQMENTVDVFGPATAPEPDFTSNLELHLAFNEGAGTTAQDSTANNHDGTLDTGASWGAAKLGASALVVDGTVDGLATVAGGLTNPTTATLAAWVFPTAWPTANNDVINLRNGIILRLLNNGSVRGSFYAGTGYVGITVSAGLALNTWHHIAYTVRANEQKVYVNGTAVGSGASGSTISYTGLPADTLIGGYPADQATFRFQGRIDDVRVYTRALSAADVSGLAALDEPAALAIQITAPTTGEAVSVSTATLTTLGGAASDSTGVTGITWSCPTCTPTSGTATCTPACGAATTFTNWSVPTLTLAVGSNLLTVTASDASGTRTDQLTVTYTPPPAAGNCTHYASPNGGGNGTTQNAPFQIAQFWAVATPGTVLCLLDGTYTGGNSMITVPTSFAGTASQPITIRALNDGKVLIAGGTSRPVHLAGNWGVLEGINASGGDNVSIRLAQGNDWVVRRVGAWNNDGRPDMSIIGVEGGARNTIEDCFAFGKARKVIAANQSGSAATIRRCWARFEECPSCQSGNPTNTIEIGYDQHGITSENNLANRNIVGVATSPEGLMNAFSTHNSKILGGIAYMGPTDNYSGTLIDVYPTAGSNAGTNYTTNFLAKDIVAIIAPSNPDFTDTLGFRFTGNGPGTGNVATNVYGIGGLPSTCTGTSWACSGIHSATTISGALAGTGHSSLWTAVPGICKRYVNGVLTNEGLWPGGQWPMNQRIKDATLASGRAAVDVTAAITSLLGPIPDSCRTSSTPEACTPPLVGTPPNCTCPAGTIPPNCDPEPDPETCPPECPVQDVFVIAPATSTPPGNDSNACTLEAPCLTINRARSLMTPGDLLSLRGGTYTGTGNRITTSTGAFPSGNDWSAPTRIAAYQNETVVLQQTSDTVITLDNPTMDRYLVFDRLVCDGASTPSNNTACVNMTNGVHHVRIQNSILRNTHFRAMLLQDVNNIEIVNTEIHGATHSSEAVRITGTSDSITLENNLIRNNNAHGIAADSATVTNLTLTRNVVRNNGGTGMQLAAQPFFAANNLVYANALGMRILTGSAASQVLFTTLADNTGAELQIDAGATDTVVTNVIAVGGIVDNGTDTVQTTNLTSDPTFVGGGNYRLADPDTSAAANAGTCLPGVVDVAIDGTARPATGCDIGAFEQNITEEPVVPGALSATPWGSSGFLVP